jgi:hypothetical protein
LIGNRDGRKTTISGTQKMGGRRVMGEAYTRMIPPACTQKDREVEHLSRYFDGLSLEKDEEDSVEKADDHAQLIQKVFLHTKL